MDPTALSHTLAGRRRLTLAEAAAIARSLAVPVEEVIQHAGISAELSSGQQSMPPLTARVDGDGTLTYLERGPSRQSAKSAERQSLAAAQFRVPDGGPWAIFDGWVFTYERRDDGVPQDALHRLCVAETSRGTIGVWLIRRGYRSGTYSLQGPCGTVVEDQELLWASPLLTLRPND